MKKLLCLFLTLISFITYGDEKSVRTYVEDLLNNSFSMLKSTSDNSLRKQKVEEILNSHLDLNTMASSVLGRMQLTDTQKTEFKPIYRQFVLNTYGKALRDYDGQTVKIKSVQNVDPQTYLVRTQVVTQDEGEPFNVDCLVRGSDNNLKVIDIITEGVSLITTHKTEFKTITANKGFNGLINELKMRSNSSK